MQFEGDDKDSRKLEMLCKMFPDGYDFDRLVYNCSKSYLDLERLWNERLSDLILYKLFTQFDNYVERAYYEGK